MSVMTKRAYEPASEADGFRILVDRVWPRGVSKTDAGIDVWLKDIAPSSSLRKWFGHDPEKWEDFKIRYFEELDRNPEAVDALRQILDEKKKVTLVYSAKDEAHNNAAALKNYLASRQ